MGTAVRPAKTSPGPWDDFADVDVFVNEVLAELEAMTKDRARPLRSGPKPPLAGAALRKAVMAIWCVCFCGMRRGGDRTAMRHPLRHALRAVRSLDPARPLAPAARPAALRLAARLQGFSGAKRRGHR
jgi:hypothetical protein